MKDDKYLSVFTKLAYASEILITCTSEGHRFRSTANASLSVPPISSRTLSPFVEP